MLSLAPEPPGCGLVSVPENQGSPFFVMVQKVPHGTKNAESNAAPCAVHVALSMRAPCFSILSFEKLSDVNAAGPKPSGSADCGAAEICQMSDALIAGCP